MRNQPCRGVRSERNDRRRRGFSLVQPRAGRAVKDDPVQAGAGIEIHAKPGERVRKGDVLFTLHTDDEWRIPRALEALDGGVRISDTAPAARSIILDRVG